MIRGIMMRLMMMRILMRILTYKCNNEDTDKDCEKNKDKMMKRAMIIIWLTMITICREKVRMVGICPWFTNTALVRNNISAMAGSTDWQAALKRRYGLGHIEPAEVGTGREKEKINLKTGCRRSIYAFLPECLKFLIIVDNKKAFDRKSCSGVQSWPDKKYVHLYL